MRIYLSGNEELASFHLPVVQEKAVELANSCKRDGLSQNAMHFGFDDTGAQVSIQYVFGQTQVFIHAPHIIDVQTQGREEEQEPTPGTFYVETTQGYFWVHVLPDEEGELQVSLIPFEAAKQSEDIFSQEFVYPAMGHRTPGMIAGCFGTEETRYVVSQACGVFVGAGQEKGTIKMPPVGSVDCRLNVEENNIAHGKFCIVENIEGKSCFFRVLDVAIDDDSEIIVGVKTGNIDMLSEGESGGIVPANLTRTPCWIHRKCTGSYFSPNKTIGFHTDIGSDDDYFGNLWAIPSGLQDKLDNGGEFGSYFNHVKELYRIAGFAAAPLELTEGFVSFLLISPTMVSSLEVGENNCWGGYGQTQTSAGCIDIQQDFSINVLAPRICVARHNFSSGSVTVTDVAGAGSSGGGSADVYIKSWDGQFGAMFRADATIKCGPTKYFESTGTGEAHDPCSWTEEGTGSCDYGGGTFIPYEKDIPKEQRYLYHWAKSFEENLRVERSIEFCFNKNSYINSPSNRNKNFYFVFEGLWHLGFAVAYLTNPSVTNQCGLCAFPPGSQAPGGIVTFIVNGSIEDGYSQQWLAENATEYVENLQIVTPLSIQSVDIGWGAHETLAFTARVPEGFAAPVEPMLLTGGIEYEAPDVEGKTIRCETSLMSSPCICDGGFSFDTSANGCGSYLSMTGGRACIQGGCGPYSWSVSGGTLVDSDGINHGASVSQTDITSFTISAIDYSCAASLTVTDACGETIQIEAEDPGGQRPVCGPGYLWQGASAGYVHGLGPDATYTGGMTVISETDNSAVLQMPSSQTEPVTIRWDGPCGWYAEMTVTPGYCDCEATAISWACHTSWCSWLTVWGGQLGIVGGCGPFTWSISGGHFVDNDGNSLGSSIISSPTRYVRVAVDTPNCQVSVSVIDDDCGTTLTKEATRADDGSITGPDVLPWENSAWYYHNVPNAVYSGGLTLVQQNSGSILLKMPTGATDTKVITLTGDCGTSVEKSVEPSYCKCSESQMAWGAYSQDIILGGTAHMYFSGGCPPFSWYGDGVSFVDSVGASIPFADRKNMRSLYVKSNDECSGSVTVSDVCNYSLSKSATISGDIYVVAGPATMEPGEQGYFAVATTSGNYDGLILADAGGMIVVQSAGNGWILRMPDGATGSKTVTWTASCGRSASCSVLATGASNLIGSVVGSAAGPVSGTISGPEILAGNYVVVNSSHFTWVNTGCPIPGRVCVSIVESSGSVSVNWVDSYYGDNAGTIAVYVYRT